MSAPFAQFEELAEIYHGLEGKSFQASSYDKVVQKVRNFPREITSGQDARMHIYGVGVKQAEKVRCIVLLSPARAADQLG